jgi:hypothetical protein
MYSLYVGEFNNHAKKASTLVVVVVVIVIGGPILFLNAGFLLSKSCLQPILYCN